MASRQVLRLEATYPPLDWSPRPALVQRVPLRSTTTLATRLGTLPEWLLTGLGLTALAVGLASRRRTVGPTRRFTQVLGRWR
ncbi:MAG: hypothetical protein M3Y73_11480 [Actinomycetota bacterium]|nr:hypothetical protein [Actinomycetota bacterium]